MKCGTMLVFHIPEFALGLKSRGEGNCVVESEAECLVGFIVTLASVEEVFL